MIAADEDERAIIAGIIERLPARERDVVRRRFGIGDGKPETLEEIGLSYGVTRERIRQIEGKALGKLRRSREMVPFRPPPAPGKPITDLTATEAS